MELLLVSFIAGALTVLAPCILPVLPLIIGGSASKQRPWQPYIITASLVVSIFIFTLLLRASTALLDIPLMVWQAISGGIIILLGILTLAPVVWEKHSVKLNVASGKLLGKTGRTRGVWHDIATGAALGPVFSSCSPTYAFILAAILPRSWLEGALNLSAYALGLGAILLAIALGGQSLVAKLGWAANPKGWFKRTIGILFIIVGVAIMFGIDKDIQAAIIDQGWYAPIENLENSLR